MVIGCVWCSKEKVKEIHQAIRLIKKDNNINPDGELKWAKISKGNLNVYNQLVNYFFDNADICFRAIVIDKKNLNHEFFNQSHDEWYYKMMYQLIHTILSAQNQYQIFLDYKDSLSGQRSAKLYDVLCNDMYDFGRKRITNVQYLPSNEIGLLQLCDILIGAIGYHQSGLKTNEGKLSIIDQIKKRSRYSLSERTPLSEKKFNLFFWEGQNRK